MNTKSPTKPIIDIDAAAEYDITTKKEYFMKNYYNKLQEVSGRDREELKESAWKSFETWSKNPLGDAGGDSVLSETIIEPLLGTSYFCPISDKDMIMEMLKPAVNYSPLKCFVMLRPSQNERPLVWVCAYGGSKKIVRVRIGVPTENNKNYTVIFKNKVTEEVEMIYQSPTIQLIMAHLCIKYASQLKVYEWCFAL